MNLSPDTPKINTTQRERERMATGLDKILVFGGTGYLGKHVVRASIKMGHPTYVYGRPITPNTDPSKMELHKEFQSMGITLIQVYFSIDHYHTSTS